MANIRKATLEDAQAIVDIYNFYVANTIITFEEKPISRKEMKRRMEVLLDAGHPWLIAEESEEVAGYAYAGPWKNRCAYQNTLESTIYLHNGMIGHGLGTLLYRKLLDTLGTHEIHALISGIALPNDASIALHEKMGFEKVAQFKEIGYKFNKWIDVGYWERLL